MPNKEANDKGRGTKRGEHQQKSTKESATEQDREKEKKLPEPPGNLRRRSEWFQKRH